MKKALGIIAVTLAAGCVFAAGCSGCNRNGKNVAPLASNWYTYTNFGNIQPTFIEDNPLFQPEELEYDVEFKKPSNGNTTYSVEYTNGSYKTKFYATHFDTSENSPLIHEDHRESYNDKDIVAYYYHTEFTADVMYKYGNKTTNDEGLDLKANIVTECYFLSVDDLLRPLYSKQVVNSPSPAVLQATSLNSCYTLFNDVYETFYNFKGSSAITVVTDNIAEKTTTDTRRVSGTNHTTFDVASLDMVLRALVGGSFSQTINLYSPLNAIKTFKISSPSKRLTATEKSTIASALKEKELYIPATADDDGTGLETKAVTVTSTSKLQGVSQTYWFAKVDNNNKRNNVGRATLLKISLPIVFNLGTLEYTLKEVKSTLWNG